MQNNRIDFGNFAKNDKKEKIYFHLWHDLPKDFFLEPLQPSRADKNGCVNSYSFGVPGFTDSLTPEEKKKCIADALIKQFAVKDIDTFRYALHKVCSGSGSEYKKITTLHSSSLCALLHFYNVSPDTSIELDLEGKPCRFTQVTFEFKNRLTKNSVGASNVDVVLAGEDLKTGEKVILFLESKFAEYCYGIAKMEKIPSAYLGDDMFSRDIYDDNVMAKLGYEKNISPDSKYFFIKSKQPGYLQGVKQMVSHYVGVRNLLMDLEKGSDTVFRGCDDKEKSIKKMIRDGARVYFGGILFDRKIGVLPISGSGSNYAKDYQKRYYELAAVLNAQLIEAGLIDRLRVLTEELKYEMITSVRDEKIRTFYYS